MNTRCQSGPYYDACGSERDEPESPGPLAVLSIRPAKRRSRYSIFGESARAATDEATRRFRLPSRLASSSRLQNPLTHRALDDVILQPVAPPKVGVQHLTENDSIGAVQERRADLY